MFGKKMGHTAVAIARKDAEADKASAMLSKAIADLNRKANHLERVVKDAVGLTYEGRK